MIIYKTTNLVNGKTYVGQDSKNNKKYLGSGKILKSAIKKYGRSSFKKEIIEYPELDLKRDSIMKSLKSGKRYKGWKIARIKNEISR